MGARKKPFCPKHTWSIMQSRISRTPYPPNGGHAVTGGPKFQSRHYLASQRKLRSPNWNMKHYKSVKLGGPLKEKCITVTLMARYFHIFLGPFESKVAHFALQLGPIWKQGGEAHVRPGCVRTPSVWDWSLNLGKDGKDCDVVDNSTPDESTKQCSYFHEHGSQL